MNDFSEKNFILIENQVAAPENDVAALLNISIEELHALCNKIGVTNTPGGIYEKDGKYYFSSDRIIFKIRDKNGKNTADLSSQKLAKIFLAAENNLLPKDILKAKRKKEHRLLLTCVAVILCFIGFIFFMAENDKSDDNKKSAPAPVQQVTAAEPGKISKRPGLGSTRAEFEKVHKETAKNSVSNIRYDNDAYLVFFFDEDGNETSDKNARAFLLTVQAVPGWDTSIDLRDFLPTDSKVTENDTKGSDNMMSLRNFKGVSPSLEKIYPKSKGKWQAGITNDAQTGAFISATFMVDIAK